MHDSETRTVHDLMIGILALQNGEVDADGLIAALRGWAADKSRRIGSILVELGHLDGPRLAALESLVEERPSRREEELRRALAEISPSEALRLVMEEVDDPAVRASLAGLTETITMEESSEVTPADAPTALARGVSARYTILCHHDSGNLGKVSIALDHELRRRVAFKQIQDHHADNPPSRDQFMLEGLVTGGLEHPGIVPVYGLGTHEDGRLYYAMRFIQGPSLRDRIEQLHGSEAARPLGEGEEPPTLARLLRHFIGACQAVAYAHDRGILHRDLKPVHVMLGPYGETLVVDWGCAMPIQGENAPRGGLELPREFDSSFGQDGRPVGTLPFMSPEQARGLHSQLDRTSDVYSLGATLYCLLTGRHPYKGFDRAEMLERVKAGEFPRPRQVRPRVPKPLEAICLKAMAFRPKDRYETAAELAKDLERWLDDEPIVARNDPPLTRVARWLRHHRTAAAGIASLLISTVLGLGALNVQMGWANRAILIERDAADDARDREFDARRGAEANFRQALEVVNNLLVQVAQTDLPRVPGTVDLRRRIAARASIHLALLWGQKPDDPEVRFQAARGYRELANILRLLGHPQADDAYERAIELLRGSVERQQEETRYRDYLAETLIDAADSFLLSGRPNRAETFAREALRLAGDLELGDPEVLAYRRTMARGLYTLANVRAVVGDPAEAVQLAEEAGRRMGPLADSVDRKPTDLLEIIMVQTIQGAALHELGELAAAERVLSDTTRRSEALLAHSDDDPDAGFLHACALLELSMALDDDVERSGEASGPLDAAISRLEDLASRFPEVVEYREYLATALLAGAARRSASDEARAVLEGARRLIRELLDESPEHPIYVGLLGRVHGQLGRLDLEAQETESARENLRQAVELQRSALEANPSSPPDLRALKAHEEALRLLPAPAEDRP